MDGIREDVEALAKALCRTYAQGATDHVPVLVGNIRTSPGEVERHVEQNWKKYIPQARKLADEIYGPLLEVCQKAYRKHALNDEEIGWESLIEHLGIALVGVMGDDNYNKWLDKMDERQA